MDEVYEGAASDATAILACLSSLSVMAMDATGMARSGAILASQATDELAKTVGSGMRNDAARALKIARERIDILMQDFGEYFNNTDGCSAAMVSLTGPMYEALRKRKEGIALD